MDKEQIKAKLSALDEDQHKLERLQKAFVNLSDEDFSFASDDDLRKQAIKMLQDGVSAKQVYEETGFFIDDKGRIRNDIDDTDSKDPAIRKPYPIARPGEALTKAREQIKAERHHHAAE